MKPFSKYLLLPLTMFSLLACHSKETVQLSRLTTPKLEKISSTFNNEMSQVSYNSYSAFAKKFAKLAIETTNEGGEESLGVSIPDAYLCLAISAVISDDEARSDVLSYLELNSIEDLRTSVKDIVRTLCTLYKNRNNKLQGGYNLNSIWLDPTQMELVKEKDEQLYKDLEEIFDASTYMEALTTDKVKDYLKENGLKDMPTPDVKLNDEQPPAMGVMSVYYCLDYFEEETKLYYKRQYDSGTHKMDYEYNGTTTKVNYIQEVRNENVYEGTKFFGADLPIQNLKMTYFLPNSKTAMPSTILGDALDGNYHLKESQYTDYDGSIRETTTHEVNISAPYFSLDNKIELEHNTLKSILPKITKKGAGARMAKSIYNYDVFLSYIKQFSVMKFNYDGFYSCSVTIAGYDANSAMPLELEKFDLKLDHPYIFEVQKNIRVNDNYYNLPIVVGEIVNPNYQD